MVLVVPEQSQRPYRFGMTLLCVGALFNWLGLADTYSDPVPAIRYIGVGLIAAGASLICMAMCFWMRNIHDPNGTGDYDVTSDSIHVISSDPSLEKPPEYSTVVDVPPSYEDAVKLSPTSIVSSSKDELKEENHSCERIISQRNNSSLAEQSCNATNFPVPPAHTAKSENRHMSQNSSQNESTFSKVFRKSIRGIRRFRNGSEGSYTTCGQPSNTENDSISQDRKNVAAAKVER